MCSPAAARHADIVVTEFVAQKKQFTVKDVTDEIKDRLKNDGEPFERHNDLKGTVHTVCSSQMDATWDRTLVQIPGVRDAAYLYHLVGTDPQDYIKALPARGSLPASIVSTPAGLASAFGPNSIATTPAGLPYGAGVYCSTRTSDPGHRSVSRRGRLIVARKLLEPLGLTVGAQAYLYLDGAELLVSKSQPTSSTTANIHVDVEGRIRLNRQTRLRLGCKDANQFALATNTTRGVVQITPA